MAYNGELIYLVGMFFKIAFIYTMRNKLFLGLAVGTLILMSALSNSQPSLKAIKATPTDELISRLSDDSSIIMLQKVYKGNNKNALETNELQLIIRGIEPNQKK